MKIFNEFEIIGTFPALYIEKIRAVVISDLHLGIESLLTSAGYLFPRFQLKEIKQDLEKIFEIKKPERLVITGDVKHEFSKITWNERKEILDFLDFLTEKVQEILIVKGNHDNFLIYAVKNYPSITLADYFILDDICFMHGHQKNLDLRQFNVKYFIIGNEHPAISLKDELGAKEIIPCFLYGTTKCGRKITVLPAFSKLSRGSEMNEISQKDLLSPILRKNVEFNKMKVIAISKELGIMSFPELGKLNYIS